MENRGNISVVKILDFEFFANEDLFINQKHPTTYSLNYFTAFGVERELFNIIVDCKFFYENSVEIIAQTQVQNVFHIPNLKSYIDEEKDSIALPPEMIIVGLGLSISHTRALFSKNLRGTLYSNLSIPIINPVEVARQMFPHVDEDLKKTENSKTAAP